MIYQDIDWNLLWQEARSRKSWKKRKRQQWDQRAASFAKRNLDSSYADAFLARLRLEPDWQVLDMGCGPGTLAIPLARRVRKVTAVDFSAAMLAELEKRARAEGLANIETIQAAWEDDWQAAGISPHDLAISSRSLAVPDLEEALLKLTGHGRRAVAVSDRVGPTPFEPEVFAAVGRVFEPGPDFIYTFNLLYSLGLLPRVDYLRLEREQRYPSLEEAEEGVAWMLNEMNDQERQRLRAYLAAKLVPAEQGGWRLPRAHPPIWALLQWEPRRRPQ